MRIEARALTLDNLVWYGGAFCPIIKLARTARITRFLLDTTDHPLCKVNTMLVEVDHDQIVTISEV